MDNNSKALDALLQGISLMIDEKLKVAGFDKSVIGFISGANLENNTYTVRINNYDYKNVPSVVGELSVNMTCICTIPQNQMSQMYISGQIDTKDYLDDEGGTSGGNYENLDNKPSINGVTLIGNKTAIDLGISQPTKTSQLTNDSNFVVDANYVHTDNNFTNALLSKLNGIENGAEVNLIDKITVNGVEQAISNKTVALTVMTNTVNDLVNYYTKSETYTKTEVNSLISAIPKFAIEVVNALPTTDISTTTIYLLRNSEQTGSNLFEEYIYVNNQWELLGSQDIDLSNYVTTSDLNTALASYVTSTNLSTILQGYVTTTMWNTLGAVATSNDYADLNNKPTTITANEISTGTDTTPKLVRADYLKAGIQAIINAMSLGHTILNKLKTALTNRPNLWFKDAYVVDDSVNSSTNIEVVQSINQSQWDNLQNTNDGLYYIDDGTSLPLSASNVSFDNTGTTLSSDNVQDAIDELNDDITKNTLGAFVDLTQYTNSSPYTAPSDGYIMTNVYGTGATATAIVNSTIGLNVTYEGYDNMNGLFVRKGMRLYGIVTGRADCRYYPLV